MTPDSEMEQLTPTGQRQMALKEGADFERDVDDFESAGFSLAEERTLLKKLDRRVVLLISGLYLLSFLDRSNIGNAKIAGLLKDLKLTDNQYEWLLTAFYAMYISFQWMTLLFKLVRPHIYLSVVVLSWGIIASLQALTTSFWPILTLRILLGISEAAFCGVPFYLSFFFRREELAFRTGIFIAAAPLANSVASSVAFLITSLSGIVPVAPWRLLFLIEGFPSILVAAYCWKHIADGPSTAWFLSKKERILAVLRLHNLNSNNGAGNVDVHSEKLLRKESPVQWREIMQTAMDAKCYLMAAMFFSCNVAYSSAPVFLPTIIQEMGYSSIWAQALSAPPYLAAFGAVLFAAFKSDKHGSRSSYIITFALIAAAGYLTIFLAGILGLPNFIRYLGLYPACMGFFTCVTLIITWNLNNQDSETKKGSATTILQFFGQMGPLLGTRLFPASDGPLYLPGMAVCAAFMAGVAVLALSLRVVLGRENARRRREVAIVVQANGGDEQPLVGEMSEAMKMKFLYVL